MTAWLARVENLSHTTWRKHNWMLFEAHSQAAIDQCRSIISIKSLRKSDEPNHYSVLSAYVEDFSPSTYSSTMGITISSSGTPKGTG